MTTQISELKEKRDELLREVKKEKSEDYKTGYFDAVLDFYNEMMSVERAEKK